MKLDFGKKSLSALGTCVVTSPMLSKPLHLCNGDTLELCFSIDVDGPEGVLVETIKGRVRRHRDRRLLLVCRA